jgi:hypothetical protein
MIKILTELAIEIKLYIFLRKEGREQGTGNREQIIIYFPHLPISPAYSSAP